MSNASKSERLFLAQISVWRYELCQSVTEGSRTGNDFRQSASIVYNMALILVKIKQNLSLPGLGFLLLLIGTYDWSHKV